MFTSQHSSSWPSAKGPAALPMALARRRGTANVFWEGGSIPFISRHTATANSGAHLPSLVKRGGVGGVPERCLIVKWSEIAHTAISHSKNRTLPQDDLLFRHSGKTQFY
jgi:hypothetical protein